MKKFLLIIIFLLGIISSVYAAANNETGDKSAVPISVYGKTADGTVTAILVDDEGKLVIEGGGSGGSGDSLWADYGSYISQDATRSGDNVWIANDLSASNLIFLDESEGLATISGSLSILDDLTVNNKLEVNDTINATGNITGNNLSGTNTGDQDLSSYLTKDGAAVLYEPKKGEDDNYVTDAQLVVIGNTIGVNTGDQDLSDYLSKSTSFVGDVTGTYNSTVVGNDSHSHTNATITLASTDLTDTADLLYEAELDTFSELQTQIADKTLVNEEDAVTWDSAITFDSTIDVNGDWTLGDTLSESGTTAYYKGVELGTGGGGTPGGSDGDIQYNNGGSFGGFGDYNDGTGLVTLSNDLSVSQSLTASNVYLQGSGDATITPTSGSLVIDGNLTVSNDLSVGGDCNVDGILLGNREYITVSVGTTYNFGSAGDIVTFDTTNISNGGLSLSSNRITGIEVGGLYLVHYMIIGDFTANTGRYVGSIVDQSGNAMSGDISGINTRALTYTSNTANANGPVLLISPTSGDTSMALEIATVDSGNRIFSGTYMTVIRLK